jgi:glycosyltransferase involved in cell wall biosynthesis
VPDDITAFGEDSVPTAAIIVPVRNAREYVCEQLDALAAEVVDRSIECIVIDDASTDGTTESIRAWIVSQGTPVQFRLVRRATRGGPNASRNTGLRESRADFVMFTDGDDIVAPGWVDAFEAMAGTDGLLCGRNADLADRSAAGDAPRAGDDAWSAPRFGGWPFAFGNCMAGPRRIFEEPGGFDENMLIGGSDAEFAIRAQRRLRIDVVGVPDALVWHRLPATVGGWIDKQFARERGYAYIRRRHRGAVHRPMFKIGVAQVGRGVLQLAASGSRTRSARAKAVHLVARGAFSIIGALWWGAVYRVRMPEPWLLHRGDASR